MLRLAFDFIIAWREIRARPNAYVKVGLSSHDYRIYTGSLQQKQAILCI